MLPKQSAVEIPLLEALVEIGGQGKAREIYPLVTRKFPQITEEDLAEKLPSGPNRWTNRIQWARQNLVASGDLDSPKVGVWRITEKGRKRLARINQVKFDNVEIVASTPTFMELYENYQASFRAHLLEKLLGLSASEFEQFGRRLLIAYGFVDVKVTQLSKDGGIDGHGRVKLGVATLRAAFQCKKWQGNVGRPEVDKFRGAIQGQFEQGVFFVTSDFTPQAKEASIRRGAVPIILFNGENIVDLMIEKEIGVSRVPLYSYQERLGDLTELDED